MDAAPAFLEFVRLPLFERTAKGLLSEEDIRRLEGDLLADPRKGDVEDNSGGVRKVRAAIGGRGKRGGARVAYLYVEERATIYLLLAFPKSMQAVFTAEQKKALRGFAAQLKKEER